MKKTFVAAVAALMTMGVAAHAAEPIEGTWKRPSTGTLVKYSGSGGKFCGTVLDGEHKGKSIGCMSGKGGNYTGQVVALDEGKTYSGKAKVTAAGLKLEGCVAMVVCKGETWVRQ